MSVERLTERTTSGVANINYSGCQFEDGERDKIAESARRQNAIERLAAIEDILGDTYDLDRLRELVEADKYGRCVMLPNRDHTNEDGENALKSAMNTCYYHNNPVTRYIADAVAEKLTREATLEKEKRDGQKESSQD